ncbi:MAG TPA: hypothetical protein VL738_13710 [Dactylosporangium sp.]|nr:hypothetical protein [Dactylosporangium sp.]
MSPCAVKIPAGARPWECPAPGALRVPTGTTPLTEQELGFLAKCGRAVLAPNDPVGERAAGWLSAHVRPNAGSAHWQCGGVAMQLRITSLQSQLDLNVPAGPNYCGES